jgi:hypothetical protein
MPSDTTTFALAAVGAATGIASAGTQIFSTVIDRPRLQTNFGMTTRVNGAATIYVEVTNIGRRATTVRQFGFYGGHKRMEFLRKDSSEPYATGTGEVAFTDGPVFLDAGQSRRIEMVPNIEEFGIHADYPFRAYAVDLRGRRIWGEAAPVVRMLFGTDPPLVETDPADFRDLFEPPRPESCAPRKSSRDGSFGSDVSCAPPRPGAHLSPSDAPMLCIAIAWGPAV